MNATPITSIKTRGQRKRRLAEAILARHCVKPCATAPPDPVRIVCVSDTHNKQPVLPPGDILIHAGDLTENGSFDEVQAGVTWLSSQPHRFKILVAGNHDVLLDEAFLERYPERRYGQSKTKQDLDWGDVIYLEDSTITLDVPVQPSPPAGAEPPTSPTGPTTTTTSRKVTIFGSPWTPQYGISAFQYPPTKGAEHWRAGLGNLVPTNTKTKPKRTRTNRDESKHRQAAPTLVVVTHGPPRLYLDRRDALHPAGCPHLLAALARLRPRLHVFGHIHAARGRADVVLDGARRAHDDVLVGWAGGRGWAALARLAVLVAWARVRRVLGLLAEEGTTTFVNAAVVGGRENELRHEAVVVEI
ncbi:7240f1e4-05ee-4e04-975a-40929cd84c24 [Thermothielavioides terrestris]|uniref:7240f1e4-05ee-4e04-975a-40929cd84c24 n=1 Tax=Thermothielavioides terrestris TaxID=2587410 RepID=A0A3S4ATL7_9PEZI|nr:7240f1e4-05ee-4e04-975a-40929cd84c24 [Thermothielavioides terrestris]